MTSRTGRTNRMGDTSRNQIDSNVGAGAGAGAGSGSDFVARNEGAGVSQEGDIFIYLFFIYQILINYRSLVTLTEASHSL